MVDITNKYDRQLYVYQNKKPILGFIVIGVILCIIGIYFLCTSDTDPNKTNLIAAGSTPYNRIPSSGSLQRTTVSSAYYDPYS